MSLLKLMYSLDEDITFRLAILDNNNFFIYILHFYIFLILYVS